MSINSHLLPDSETVLIAVEGRFDESQENDFLHHLWKYPKGEKGYLLDLSNTQIITSTAIGLIIMMCEYSSVRQKVKISNAKGFVLASLTTAHVEKFVEFI